MSAPCAARAWANTRARKAVYRSGFRRQPPDGVPTEAVVYLQWSCSFRLPPIGALNAVMVRSVRAVGTRGPLKVAESRRPSFDTAARSRLERATGESDQLVGDGVVVLPRVVVSGDRKPATSKSDPPVTR